MKKRMLILIVIVSALPALFAQPQAPAGLICELLRDPARAVITDPKPEFGWIVNDARKGARQTAYQIIVSSSEAKTLRLQGDLWDSGRVLSNQSINNEYNGAPLPENGMFWWRVRTWDADSLAGEWSLPQSVRTGDFDNTEKKWPAESRWVQTGDGQWLLENRQRSEYVRISPLSLKKIGEGQYFADFGKAAFATLEFELDSPKAGDSVIVYLGERKTADNRVHKNPGRSNIGFKRMVVALKKGQNKYFLKLPRHISHYPNSQVLAEHMPEVLPFRYVEMLNVPGQLTAADIRQVALYYYFDDAASHFVSSNENLNKVWDLCKYTLKATPFLALYADGNRERMPYEADAYIQQLGHYNVDREYSVARYTNQFLIFNPSWPTEWHLHTVLMAAADYFYTGDMENIRAYYDEFAKKTLIDLTTDKGLISTRTGLVTEEFLESIHYKGKSFRDIVDWPPGTPPGKKQASNASPLPGGERDGFVFTDYNAVVNALHYQTLRMMALFADALGKGDDRQFYLSRAEEVKRYFNDMFLDPVRGIYRDGETSDHASLHANMFPLAFNMVPENYIPTVVDFIKSRGMACGVYGAQYLLDALFNAGEADYAVSLMASEDKRSWMNMIRVGSSMTTEAWDEYFKPNLTWNHAWGSAPANIIPRRLFGIQPLEPGWGKALIKPQLNPLHRAEIRVPTIRGPIDAEWQNGRKGYRFTIRIPANMTAQVWLPKDGRPVTESGIPLEAAEGVRIIESKDNYYICEIGAGQYKFASDNNR